MPMVSVMATGSEAFGSCVGGIDVSVRMENRGVWLCYALICLGFIRWEKWLKISGGGGRWCQVSEAVWGWLRVDEEIKSPCGDRSFV